jgi:hypothetical protein
MENDNKHNDELHDIRGYIWYKITKDGRVWSVKRQKFLRHHIVNGYKMITFPSDKAYFSKFGIYKNNKWQMKKEFIPSNKGWEIPDKYVR